MRNLIILLFTTALMFSCSKEEAEEAMDKAGDMAEDAMESAGEMAEDAAETAGDMAEDAAGTAEEMVDGDMKGPEVEDLPDWDSLPPIEEEMADEGAEDGSTMMEKAEEEAGEMKDKAVEMAKEKAGDMMKKE